MGLREDQLAFVERVEATADAVFARTGIRPEKVQITSVMAVELGLATGSEVAGLPVEVVDLFGEVIRHAGTTTKAAPVDDAALRAAILRDVTDAGGMGWTVPECAARHGLRIAQAYRQLDRLAKAGLIRRGGVRSVDGRPSVCFVAMEGA